MNIDKVSKHQDGHCAQNLETQQLASKKLDKACQLFSSFERVFRNNVLVELERPPVNLKPSLSKMQSIRSKVTSQQF